MTGRVVGGNTNGIGIRKRYGVWEWELRANFEADEVVDVWDVLPKPVVGIVEVPAAGMYPSKSEGSDRRTANGQSA